MQTEFEKETVFVKRLAKEDREQKENQYHFTFDLSP